MDVLKTIREKIQYWIDYEKNLPKGDYEENKVGHDDYRRQNDLDCILLGRDLHADKMISLWLPLRGVLVELNGYPALNKLGRIEKSSRFLKKLQENLTEYLPLDNETVLVLSTLFELGQRRYNVMRLPDGQRWLNSARGRNPYYYYMPYFLSECFGGGNFSKAFKHDEDFIDWVKQEKLQVFFKDEKISQENIFDLSGKGITCNIPENWFAFLKSYIQMLEERERLLEND